MSENEPGGCAPLHAMKTTDEKMREAFEKWFGFTISDDMDINTEIQWDYWKVAWNAAWNAASTPVTCQIYGHVVGACVECNTHAEALSQPAAEWWSRIGKLRGALDAIAMRYDDHELRDVAKEALRLDDIAMLAAAPTPPQEQPARVHTHTTREFTLKDRQFSHEGDGYIQDNNFDFDAGLRVSGDFVDDEKERYAQMIVDALNRPQEQPEAVEPVAFCNVEDVFGNDPDNVPDSILTQCGVKRGDKLYTRKFSPTATQALRMAADRLCDLSARHLKNGDIELGNGVNQAANYVCSLIPPTEFDQQAFALGVKMAVEAAWIIVIEEMMDDVDMASVITRNTIKERFDTISLTPPTDTVTPDGYISHDAYRGAMERAYLAEKRLHAAQEELAQLRTTNDNLVRALAEEVNGPTFMGEPVLTDTVTMTREELEAVAEVLRISDRKHDAWDKAKAFVSQHMPEVGK